MIKLNELIVTHNHLRHEDTLPAMASEIVNGFWDENRLKKYSLEHHLDRVSPLIQLVKLEDRAIYIHDGHHRVGSIYLAGRDYLDDSEYVLTEWTYNRYLNINYKTGWYTPFDLRTHCRKADFADFKNSVKQRFNSGENPDTLCHWIRHNAHLYCEPRTAYHISMIVANAEAKMIEKQFHESLFLPLGEGQKLLEKANELLKEHNHV